MNRTERQLAWVARIALTLTLTLAPAVWAQSLTSQQAAKQDVTIVIQQQQVRFASTQVVEQLHLQVTDQAGEVVFDSGASGVQEINWPLQYPNGAPLKSGLYAYTLTVKKTGAAEARVRRGHFIVDRAQDRDSQTDRLWVTSQGQSGVGTELTVAQSEEVTVAGASTNRAQSNLPARDQSQRTIEENNQTQGNKTENQQLKGTAAAQTVSGSLTLQGSEDPLLELNHIGSSGSPAIWFKQDGVPKAFVWWDKYNRRLNLGTPGINPILALQDNGNVGIGTDTPLQKLHVSGLDTRLRLQSTLTDRWTATEYKTDAREWHTGVGGSTVSNGLNNKYYIADLTVGQIRMAVDTSGNVGIGTATPGAKLHVEGSGGPIETTIKSNGDRAFLSLDSTINGQNRKWSVESGIFGAPGLFGIYDWQAQRAGLTIDTNGLVAVRALQITGGADFAEHFDVNLAETTAAATTKVEAGMVVSIDPASPGKLQLSTRAYDRRVAGIISGAGGVKPGMMMSQAGTLADGQHPVALSGRVYCWVDASFGAVKPGNLLTTSATPGHAMRVANAAKAQGAIIGKAMTGLKQGKGLVLVLVTLQ